MNQFIADHSQMNRMQPSQKDDYLGRTEPKVTVTGGSGLRRKALWSGPTQRGLGRIARRHCEREETV
jgi:hypothetical protein